MISFAKMKKKISIDKILKLKNIHAWSWSLNGE